MNQGTSGQPVPNAGSFKLDAFSVCVAMGVALIAAGVLLAIEDLDEGGSYAFWFALREVVKLAAVGVLVLLCALRLRDATWGPQLLRAAPAIGIAVVLASVAITLKDIADGVGESFWRPLNDLFFYIPVTLGVAIYLSAVPRTDRVLGSPWQWGRVLGAVALVAGLAIAIDDTSDAGGDELWVFLSSLAIMAGPALFLIAVSLEPAAGMTAAQGGRIKMAELLNDARLPGWLAIGGAAIFVAGILLGLDSLDAPSDGFLFLLRDWSYYLGLGAIVFIASGASLRGLRSDHPYLRYALIAGLAAMVLSGLKFAADASSDQIWVFLSASIEDSAFLALALAMYEAGARVRAEAHEERV